MHQAFRTRSHAASQVKDVVRAAQGEVSECDAATENVKNLIRPGRQERN